MSYTVRLPGRTFYTLASIICVHIWRLQRNIPRILCTNHPISRGWGVDALSPDPDISPHSPLSPGSHFSPTDTSPPSPTPDLPTDSARPGGFLNCPVPTSGLGPACPTFCCLWTPPGRGWREEGQGRLRPLTNAEQG